MNRRSACLFPAAALALVALSMPAHAAGNRAAAQALPAAAKPAATCGVKGTLPCAVGPKDGFPENRGLENARRQASDNAAFKRADSPGG